MRASAWWLLTLACCSAVYPVRSAASAPPDTTYQPSDNSTATASRLGPPEALSTRAGDTAPNANIPPPTCGDPSPDAVTTRWSPWIWGRGEFIDWRFRDAGSPPW
jgi:hypothetical protein